MKHSARTSDAPPQPQRGSEGRLHVAVTPKADDVEPYANVPCTD